LLGNDGIISVTINFLLRYEGFCFCSVWMAVIISCMAGCDTNGHTNKPASLQYRNNIRLVDEGVDRIVQAVNRWGGCSSRLNITFVLRQFTCQFLLSFF
jgi:hypothetical protein